MSKISINNFVDGFVAFLFAITGPVAIILSITSTNNIDLDYVSVWLFGCFAINGILSIIITLIYKQPLIFMWSIPGMILIGFSLKTYSMEEIVGVYIISSAILVFLSFTNLISFLKKNIPIEIVMGMVGAIFISFCLNWVNSLKTNFVLCGIMTLSFFIALIISKKIKFPPPLFCCLISGLIFVHFQTDFNYSDYEPNIIVPYLTSPEFNLNSIIELTIPLIITVIFIQNGQGLALLESRGYQPPINQITYSCGFGSFVNAYFGAVSTCLTGPVTGIIINDQNVKYHFISAIIFSILCVVFGLYSPYVLDLMKNLPKEFIATLGGLALLTVLKQSFVDAFKNERALSALVTFLVTLSEINFMNIGAPFWGLIAGFFVFKLTEK